MPENSNATSLASFAAHVTELRRGIKRQYDRSVNKDLSQQNWQGLFQRNVTGVLRQCYSDALKRLEQLPFVAAQGEPLAHTALDAFAGFADELLQYALQKHRTTCAISNFPEEHDPSQAYLAQVLEQTRTDWEAFASQVDALLAEAGTAQA